MTGVGWVECEHPSAHTNHQQVYSAVALTEQLCSGASDGPAERAIADIGREADDVAAHEELQEPPRRGSRLSTSLRSGLPSTMFLWSSPSSLASGASTSLIVSTSPSSCQ